MPTTSRATATATPFHLACGCSPLGQCPAARKLGERIAYAEAGIRVLSRQGLSGEHLVQAELRIGEQQRKVAVLTAELAPHLTA